MGFPLLRCPAVNDIAILVIDGDDCAFDFFTAGCSLVYFELDFFIDQFVNFLLCIVDKVFTFKCDCAVFGNLDCNLICVSISGRGAVFNEFIGLAGFKLVTEVMGFAFLRCPAVNFLAILVIDCDDCAFDFFTAGCRLVYVELDLFIDQFIDACFFIVLQIVTLSLDCSVLGYLNRNFIDVSVSGRSAVFNELIGLTCFELGTEVVCFTLLRCPGVNDFVILVIDCDDCAFDFFAGACSCLVYVELDFFIDQFIDACFLVVLQVFAFGCDCTVFSYLNRDFIDITISGRSAIFSQLICVACFELGTEVVCFTLL